MILHAYVDIYVLYVCIVSHRCDYITCLSKASWKGCMLLVCIDEPTISEEVWSHRDANKWHKATDSEYQSLENMKVWDLVEPPANVNTVCCK